MVTSVAAVADIVPRQDDINSILIHKFTAGRACNVIINHTQPQRSLIS